MNILKQAYRWLISRQGALFALGAGISTVALIILALTVNWSPIRRFLWMAGIGYLVAIPFVRKQWLELCICSTVIFLVWLGIGPSRTPQQRHEMFYTRVLSNDPWVMRLEIDSRMSEELLQGAHPVSIPGGDLIAFTREDALIVANLSDNTENELRPQIDRSLVSNSTATWSDNGRYLAAWFANPDGELEIWVTDQNTLSYQSINTVIVTPTVGLNLDWFNEGREDHLLFVKSLGGTPNVFLATSPSWEEVNVSNSGYTDTCPSWAPDGRSIAFVSNRDSQTNAIYTVSPDGSSLTLLQDTMELPISINQTLAWSPDGKMIAFVADVEQKPEIYILEVETGTVRRLTYYPEAVDAGPVWISTDRLIFVSDRDGDCELFTTNANGSGVEQLTHNSVPDWLGPYSCRHGVNTP